MAVFVRVLSALLLVVASSRSVAADAGDSVPLCPPSQAGCVTSNWGQTEPDGVDASAAPLVAPRTVRSRISMAIQPIPVALRGSTDKTPVRSVVSPANVFPRETNALIAAIKRARFHRDGTIASGGDAIEATSAALAKKAGNRYVLTLYIKTPQTIRPEDSASLFKRVDAVNAALGGGLAQDR